MRFTVAEIVTATRGRPAAGPPVGLVVDGASIDSRTLQPGQLFVPVVAERDGHAFVGAAVRAGAPVYLTSVGPVAAADGPLADERGRVGRSGDGGPAGALAIEVPDTVAALAELGAAARARVPGGVIGVTGSVGKTSVKDMAAVAVRSTFVATVADKSFNNEIGVPLTLVNGPDDSEVAVIEMGSRGIGHIAELCAIARPTVGVVTRVAPAHLELFGTIDEVAKGKGELVEALPAAGTAVLNADDARVAAMAARTGASVLTYGVGAAADVRAEDVALDELARARFTLRSPWGAVAVRLAVSGEHMVGNALAAVAAAVSVGVDLTAAAEALATMRPSAWRMEVTRTRSGVVVVNDAYNASPVAMVAAFAAVARMAPSGAGRVALLGPMAELGDGSEDAHREVAAAAAQQGIRVIGVATDRYGPGVTAVEDDDAALAAVRDLRAGDVVLVKASRVAGLERLAQRLVAGDA